MKNQIIAFIFSLLSSSVFSQTGFGVGYNVGFYNPSLRNIEVLTYEFNEDHPNYTTQYDFNNFYRGFTAMVYNNNYKFGLDVGQEFRWSNRVITASAVGADNPGDTVYKHKLRVAMNTFSWGAYVMPSKNLKIGIDWDVISRCTLTKRVAPENDFKDEKRAPIFAKKGFFTFGFTFFAEYQISIFKIRPYYQMDILPGDMSFGLNTYTFKTANAGISLCIGTESSD